jgi:hypothetical protein
VGWCSEFGVEIAPCDHPMVAGGDACHCEVCGTRCEGKFEGCPDVWARGPVQVELIRQPTRAKSNGSQPDASITDSPTSEIPHASTPSVHHINGVDELRTSLRRLEARVNSLEMSVRDESRLDRLDEAIARMLDALVALELKAQSPPRRVSSGRGPDLRSSGTTD